MKNTEYQPHKRETYIRVGLLTIVGLLILFFGYGWMSGLLSRARYTRMQVSFENAGNIEPGSAVTLYGVRKGRVDTITIKEWGVIIDMLVELDFPLPVDTEFLIRDADLMGNRQIDIIPGSSSEMLGPDDIPSGSNLTSLAGLVPKLSDIVADIDRIIKSLSSRDDLMEDLFETISSSRKLMESLESFFSANYNELGEIVANLHQTSREINTILSEERDTIRSTVHTVSGSVAELEEVLVKINNMLDEVEPVMEKISREEGTLHYLLTEKDLYENLLKTSAEIDSLIYDIRENPKRYFQFRLF